MTDKKFHITFPKKGAPPATGGARAVNVIELPSRSRLGSIDVFVDSQTMADLRPAVDALLPAAPHPAWQFLGSNMSFLLPRHFEKKTPVSKCLVFGAPADKSPRGGVETVPAIFIQHAAGKPKRSEPHDAEWERLLGSAQVAAYAEVISGLPGLDPETIARQDALGNTLLHYFAASVSYLRSRVSEKVSDEDVQRQDRDLADATRAVIEKCPAAIAVTDPRGQTPLFWAAERGATAMVGELIARGAAVNVQDSSGRSPLLLAVMNGRAAIAHALIRAGADVHARANDGTSPAELGESLGMMEPASMPELSITPLHLAASKRDAAAISKLIAEGAEVAKQASGGATPLHMCVSRRERIAADTDWAQIIKLLAGCDGSAWAIPDDMGRTALHAAFENFALSEDDLLATVQSARAGFSGWQTLLEQKDARGKTVLHHASGRKLERLVGHLLRECGAAPDGNAAANSPAPRTPTPTKRARPKTPRGGTGKRRVEWPAPWQTPAEGEGEHIATPLATAIMAGSKSIAMMLAEAGARATGTGDCGEPVLWLAAKTFGRDDAGWDFYAALVRALPGADPNPSWRGIDVLRMAAETNAHGIAVLSGDLGVLVSHEPLPEDGTSHGILEFFMSHVDPAKRPQRIATPTKSGTHPPAGPAKSPRATPEKRRLSEFQVSRSSPPLVLAAAAGLLDCVRELLARSPVGPEHSHWLSLPLAVACARGHIEIAEDLLARIGARHVPEGVRGEPETSPLVLSAALGQLPAVIAILRHGTDSDDAARHEIFVAIHWCLLAFAAPLVGAHPDRRAVIADRVCRVLLSRAGPAVDHGAFPEAVSSLNAAIAKRFWGVSARLISRIAAASPEQDELLLAALPSRVIHPPTIGGEECQDSLEFVHAVLSRFGATERSVSLASVAWDSRGLEACIRADVSSPNPLPFLRHIQQECRVCVASPRKLQLHRTHTFYSPVLDSPNSGAFSLLPARVLSLIFSFLPKADATSLRRCCKHLAYGASRDEASEVVVGSFLSVTSRTPGTLLSALATGDSQLLDLIIWRDGGRTRFVDAILEKNVFPLLVAASLAQPLCASLLLCRGARPDGPSGAAAPPLHASLFLLGVATVSSGETLAAKVVGQRRLMAERHSKIAVELIRAGADVHRRLPMSAISSAVERCRKTKVPSCLDGTEPSSLVSPLSLACYAKSPSLVKLLLEHGASPEPPSDGLLTPMQALLSPLCAVPKQGSDAALWGPPDVEEIGSLLLSSSRSHAVSAPHPVYCCSLQKLAALSGHWRLAASLLPEANPLEFSAGTCPLDLAAAAAPVDVLRAMLRSPAVAERTGEDEASLLSGRILEKLGSVEDKLSKFKHVPPAMDRRIHRCLASPSPIEALAGLAREHPTDVAELRRIGEIAQVSPLGFAIAAENVEACRCILEAAPAWVAWKPEVSYVLLHAAALHGNVDILNLLLSARFGTGSIDRAMACEAAPLVYAAAGGNVECINALTSAGAPPTVSALGTALAAGKAGAAARLLELMPGKLTVEPLPPCVSIARYPAAFGLLHIAAARCKDPALVQALLTRMQPLPAGAFDGQEETPLDLAIAEGHDAISDVLAAAGVKSATGVLSAAQQKAASVLHGACASGADVAGITKLLEVDRADPFAEINLSISRKTTPLLTAVGSRREAIVSALLSHWNILPSHAAHLLECLQLSAKVGSFAIADTLLEALERAGSPRTAAQLLELATASAKSGHEEFALHLLPRCTGSDEAWTELCVLALTQGLLGLVQVLAKEVAPAPAWQLALGKCRPFLPLKVSLALEMAGVIAPAPAAAKSLASSGISPSCVALLEWKMGRWPKLTFAPSACDTTAIIGRIESELISKINSVTAPLGISIRVNWASFEASLPGPVAHEVALSLSNGVVLWGLADMVREMAIDRSVLSSVHRLMDSIAVVPSQVSPDVAIIGKELRAPLVVGEAADEGGHRSIELAPVADWAEKLFHFKEFLAVSAASKTIQHLTELAKRTLGHAVDVEVLFETFGGFTAIRECFTQVRAAQLFEDAYLKLRDSSDLKAVTRVIFLHTESAADVGDQGCWAPSGLACVFSTSEPK